MQWSRFSLPVCRPSIIKTTCHYSSLQYCCSIHIEVYSQETLHIWFSSGVYEELLRRNIVKILREYWNCSSGLKALSHLSVLSRMWVLSWQLDLHTSPSPHHCCSGSGWHQDTEIYLALSPRTDTRVSGLQMCVLMPKTELPLVLVSAAEMPLKVLYYLASSRFRNPTLFLYQIFIYFVLASPSESFEENSIFHRKPYFPIC